MKNRNLDNHDNWKTPPYLYNKLNGEFKFDFDPCPLNHDLSKWDGLEIEWGNRNFVNPGYSLKIKTGFVLKGIEEYKKGKLCIFLLAVSTSTALFHDIILTNITEKIRFLKGRTPFIGKNQKGQFVNYNLIQEVDAIAKISFIDKEGKKKLIPKYIKSLGQHDSMIVIFDGR